MNESVYLYVDLPSVQVYPRDHNHQIQQIQTLSYVLNKKIVTKVWFLETTEDVNCTLYCLNFAVGVLDPERTISVKFSPLMSHLFQLF